jgi:isopenicillin N synthase-like dioxygenase
MEYGFFYVVNHGIERALLEQVFSNSRKFFKQTMGEKMALRKNSSYRGYTWPYSEKVDDSPEGQDESSHQAASPPPCLMQNNHYKKLVNMHVMLDLRRYLKTVTDSFRIL